MKLWVVGKFNALNPHRQWKFQGIFDDEQVATALCVDKTWFVGPVILNEPAPSETTVWPGAYYPHTKKIIEVKEGAYMKGKFEKGGLIEKTRKDSIFILLYGAGYVSKAAAKKCGTEFFRKINEGGQPPPKLPQLQKNYRVKE